MCRPESRPRFRVRGPGEPSIFRRMSELDERGSRGRRWVDRVRGAGEEDLRSFGVLGRGVEGLLPFYRGQGMGSTSR